MLIKTICKFFKFFHVNESPRASVINTHSAPPAKTSLEEKKVQSPKLSEEHLEIIKEFFTENEHTLPSGTRFLHGGSVDFSFYPLSNKPIWLAAFIDDASDFAYGRRSGRRYQTVFSSQRNLRLLQFKLENTAILASKLGGLSIEALDQLLELYLITYEGVDGLIGPTNNVMLLKPNKLIASENYSREKELEFSNFCQNILSAGMLELKRLYTGEPVHHFSESYRVAFPISVLKLNCSIDNLTSLKRLSVEEALYHFAKQQGALSLIDIDSFFVEAPYFEKINVLKSA